MGIFLISLISSVSAQSPEQYQKFIRTAQHPGTENVLMRWWDKMMGNAKPFDASYAIVIGVSTYDNLNNIPSVKGDVEKMVKFLREDEGYDEVVVLENGDASFTAIQYLSPL